MSTTAGAVLAARYQLQIVRAFRAERALSGPSARRLRDLGLKDTEVLRQLIATAVIRKAGPERFFLDEDVWAARRHWPVWRLALVVLGVILLMALGVLFLDSRH
jgi:hypothetical protein